MEPLYFYGHTPTRDTFKRYYFSQFYPTKFVENGVEYWCCEQYMMSKKAQLFAIGLNKTYNTDLCKNIMESTDAKQIKSFGRKVRGFDEKIWSDSRYKIVVAGNFLKFSQNPLLRDALLATGDRVLAEASPSDNIWGIGLSRADAERQPVIKWRGLNLLGDALMEVRARLATKN